jgi:hypothetical protein
MQTSGDWLCMAIMVLENSLCDPDVQCEFETQAVVEASVHNVLYLMTKQ